MARIGAFGGLLTAVALILIAGATMLATRKAKAEGEMGSETPPTPALTRSEGKTSRRKAR